MFISYQEEQCLVKWSPSLRAMFQTITHFLQRRRREPREANVSQPGDNQRFKMFYWKVASFILQGVTDTTLISMSSSFRNFSFLLLQCKILLPTFLQWKVLYPTLLQCKVLYPTLLKCKILLPTLLQCKVLYPTLLQCKVLYPTLLQCKILYPTLL